MSIVDVFEGSILDQINAGNVWHIPHATANRKGKQKIALDKKNNNKKTLNDVTNKSLQCKLEN